VNRLVTIRIRIVPSLRWLVLPAIVGVIGAILFPVFAQAKSGGHRPSTLSKVRQLSTSLCIYLSDYDYVHPLADRDIQEALDPYTKNPSLFYSNGVPISYNERLGGTHEPLGSKPRVAFSYPVVIADGMYIGRTDASAEYVRTERLENEEWEPCKAGKP
jgi:hypothetical protein